MRAFKHGPCATVMFKMKIDFPRKALQESEQDFAQRFQIGKLTKEGEHYITLHYISCMFLRKKDIGLQQRQLRKYEHLNFRL